MRTIRYSIFCMAVAAAFASCNSQPEKIVVELPALRASSILEDDSVYAYLHRYGDSNKEMAESYAKKSIELQEKNPAKSVYYLRRAITLHPTLDHYKQLGSLLMDSWSYKDAAAVYWFLLNKAYVQEQDGKYKEEYLFGEPEMSIYRDYMVASIMNNNSFDAYPVYLAREAGLDIQELKNEIISDKRLKLDKKSSSYKNFLLQFMSDDEIEAFRKSPENFNNYLESFRDSSPVFDIDENNVRYFRYDDFNGMNYEGEDMGYTVSDLAMYFLEEMREKPNGWFVYNCNHIIKINDDITAVVYAIDSSATACPLDMRHIYHRLVTYNKRGNVLDSRVIAWQAGEELGTVQFDRNAFLVHEFNRTWKNPYDMNDFDNDLVKVEEKSVKSYRIDESGKILREEIERE